MSCFYPGDDTINALTTYFRTFECTLDSIYLPQEIVNELLRQAIESINYRYPGQYDYSKHELTFQEDEYFIRRPDVHQYAIGLSEFYAYQSCEPDAWTDSLACKIVNAIQVEAARRIVNIEPYWGYQKPQK